MAKNTNYNKISTDSVKEEKVENTVTPEKPIEQAEPIKIVKGVVANCSRLNVRKEPKKNAEVSTIINVGDKVEVEPDVSTAKWYKVTTKSGIEGYCMKEFITLK